MLNNENKKPLVKGIVLEALPATTFKVKTESGEEVLAYLSGKMRINYIKIIPGDRVLIEVSPDGKRGRITRRV